MTRNNQDYRWVSSQKSATAIKVHSRKSTTNQCRKSYRMAELMSSNSCIEKLIWVISKKHYSRLSRSKPTPTMKEKKEKKMISTWERIWLPEAALKNIREMKYFSYTRISLKQSQSQSSNLHRDRKMLVLLINTSLRVTHFPSHPIERALKMKSVKTVNQNKNRH